MEHTNMAIPDLPELPATHEELAKYISDNPDKPVEEILGPYRKYEAQLRSVYAQDRQNPILEDPHLNVLPLFNENTKYITTRARDLAAESEEEKSKYIMALPDDKRRPHGSPATVGNLAEFQKNFNVFSESSLVDLDWSNVVAAGSSVVNCLLPVPKEFNTTKRKLREYYHEKFCPASDVDLFLYGLTHDEAIEKIKKIERAIRDALLNEVTVVRTKYAITIASQYPVRHVQIVLRVYKTVSEILTGFDIDAAGGAYDGKQVYVTPRALGSFITQINHIDLSRRSPSYENRLSKYSHRNFEVYWSELDRSRVDPTIFERSFGRTLGLARLLVLERLPTTSARENYLNKRRKERGRPTVNRGYNRHLFGNIKDDHEDEVADWLSEEEVSNYHTFTVPYGQKFHAKRIEKLCYTRDLLLNAEWNQPKEREVYLHRHPAFFGRVQDVIEDCCGTCPEPKTGDEKEVAEKEREVYISGKVAFLIDDPGRQQIGSFNPLTESDWTDMAYVGNTARLCQSIVDGDIDDILNWLSQPDSDPNTRDYTGRTPLHLAVVTSTPEVVKCLVDHGARLTARLADGRTALHLAASRGDTAMIKTLMEKSIENEEAEEEKKDKRRAAAKSEDTTEKLDSDKESDEDDEDEDDWEQSEIDVQSATTGSFMKVQKGEENNQGDDSVPEESEDDPDYYQIDVTAWDVPCSPLHLAIVGGHEEAVKLLCDYGADSILPVKFLNNESDETAALLTLTLALTLSGPKAKSMAQLLLSLGAVSSQATQDGNTAFLRYVESGSLSMLDTLLDQDKTGVKAAINHLGSARGRYYWGTDLVSPLNIAIQKEDPILILKLLNAGASPEIDFESWLKSAKVSSAMSSNLKDLDHNKQKFKDTVQPLLEAVRWGQVDTIVELLERGANPNTLTPETESILKNEYRQRWTRGYSVLDVVQSYIKRLQEHEADKDPQPPQKCPGLDTYLQNFQPGTYRHWVVSRNVERDQKAFEKRKEAYEERAMAGQDDEIAEGNEAKAKYRLELISDMEKIEKQLLSKGAKTFAELYPDIKGPQNESSHSYSSVRKDETVKPYEYEFRFRHDKDITDRRRDGYIELFEAAWTGDIQRLKHLTLQAWGEEQDQPPLKMAIRDDEYNSPFSIAFLRGHLEMARTVLDIVKAQWTPEGKGNVRYRMKTGEAEDGGTEYSDSEGYSDDESDGDPDVVSQKIDHTFTIDNVGQVSMQVESHVQPLSVITNDCHTFVIEYGETRHLSNRSLFVHCLDIDDSAGLKLLLDLAQQWAKHGSEQQEEAEEVGNGFDFPLSAFKYAIENGKTRLLGQIIKRTGAGIPLDHLVKKSGVEMQKKPKYYQGLTVYGKKRKDWATAGRNMVVHTTGVKTPPLLIAALAVNLESVEFFLSESPNRLYAEYGKSKAAREDPRLKHLMERPGGFDRAISGWLGADNELVIHCAVLAKPGKRANEVLEYLIESFPSALEKRSPSGDTPLLVACRLGRHQFVNILIAGDANQAVRNSSGENIIHAALKQPPSAHRLKALLDELDPELRTSQFLQRKDLSDNGQTPIQQWISSHACSTIQEEDIKTLHLLLEYSEGQGLDMLTAAGDTSLHTAVMGGQVAIAKTLIDHKPSLLFRENAVGRTPAEIAYETLTSSQLAKPGILGYESDHDHFRWFYNKSPESFIGYLKTEGEKTPGDSAEIEKLGLSGLYMAADVADIKSLMALPGSDRNAVQRKKLQRHLLWDLCKTAMQKHPHPRRLVSLNEANDVVRRLGEQEMRSRYFSVNARHEEYEDEEEKPEDTAQSVLSGGFSVPWYAIHSDVATEDEEFEKCDECGNLHE